MEVLLMARHDEHPRVLKTRKEIIDQISLGQLIRWHDVTSSDLVVHHISRRLLQTPAVLNKDDPSAELRVYSERGTGIYHISKDLLEGLEQSVKTYSQLTKGRLRRLLDIPLNLLPTKTEEVTSVDIINTENNRRNFIWHCRKLVMQMVVPGTRDSNKGGLTMNTPINELGELAQKGLKLDGHGVSSSQLEQMAHHLGMQSVVVDGGFLRCNHRGEFNFSQNIPVHFTERYLNTPLIEGVKRREEENPNIEGQGRMVEYAVVMSVITREVGEDLSDGHISRLPATIQGDVHGQPSSDGRYDSLPEETTTRLSSGSSDSSFSNPLFARRYALQDKRIPGKDHIKFAYDQQAKETVVLKFYRSQETFENARDMYDGLDPQYVCKKLCEIEEPGYDPCIVFEKAEFSLEDSMNNKNWAATAKKPCLQQILLCLDHLSRRDIVHCDLKPSNILFFLSTYSWKLADLDNARLASWPASISYSLAYAAPEVLLAEEKGLTEIVLDPSTDMWSFGIMAFEVLSGKRFYGRKVTSDRVKEHLCDRTRPLPSLEYIEESQMKRLLENVLVYEPGKRWSTKEALDTLQINEAESQQINVQQTHIDQIAQAITSSLAPTVNAQVHSAIGQLQDVINEVRAVTLRTLQEVESANLMANIVVEELQKSDTATSFELREGTEALMTGDDYLEEPVFILRLNEAYRIRVSLQHLQARQGTIGEIRGVFLELPDGTSRELVIKPSDSNNHEVLALLCPKELGYKKMQSVSKSWANPGDKYVQLKITVEFDCEGIPNNTMRLDGTVYCMMVTKTSPLLMRKAINSAADMWKKCPQWIRTGARGVIFLAKTFIPIAAAAAAGDTSAVVAIRSAIKEHN